MLKRWHRYPLAYGKLIPPEARVDSTRFPEDEYPVICPKCRYLLRGIADGPCPECGKPFDKGRLLVEQYVVEGGLNLHPRRARMARRALWASIVVPILSGLGFSLYMRYIYIPAGIAPGNIQNLLIGARVWIAVLGSVGVLVIVSIALSVRMPPRNRRMSRQVFDAIDLAGARSPPQRDD